MTWARVRERPFAVAALVALPTGTLVIVFGVLAFLPFHGLHALGLSEGAIVASHLVACGALALGLRGAPSALPRAIVAVIAALPTAMLVVLVAGASAVPDAALRIAISVGALASLVAICAALPVRRAVTVSAPPPAAAQDVPAE